MLKNSGKTDDDQQTEKYTCQEVYCYAKSPLTLLKKSPRSVDLREYGLVTQARNQKSCGSCWIFGTVGALENAILLDNLQYYGQDKTQLNWHQSLTEKNVDISEQFYLLNAYTRTMLCGGSDSTSLLDMMAQDEYFTTIEMESDFAYSYDNNAKIQFATKKRSSIINNDILNNKYTPFKLFDRISNDFAIGSDRVPMIGLYDYSEDSYLKFDPLMVQSYLTRGIAVIAGMYCSTSSVAETTIYNYDKTFGVIKDIGCPSDGSDHQVLFAGFGYKDGVKSWLIKNSWGTDWGHDGYFYVRMGSNEFCIEEYAFAVIPEGYFDENGKERYQAFDSSNYQLDNDFNIKRNDNGFDADDGQQVDITFENIKIKQEKHWKMALLISLLSVAVIAAFIFLFWAAHGYYKQRRANNQPVNIDSVEVGHQ